MHQKHGQESNSLGDAKHERIAGASGESSEKRRVVPRFPSYLGVWYYVHVAFFRVKTPTKQRRFRFYSVFGGSYNILCQEASEITN